MDRQKVSTRMYPKTEEGTYQSNYESPTKGVKLVGLPGVVLSYHAHIDSIRLVNAPSRGIFCVLSAAKQNISAALDCYGLVDTRLKLQVSFDRQH